nr:prolactin-like [Meriones unguiculatus]
MNSQGSSQKAGKLLLMVISNLLFCQNVHPLPICPSGDCQMSLRELFDRVIMLSHYIHNLSTEMFIEYPEVLLNLILSLVHSWNDPLYQLATEVGGIHEAPDAIISRAKEIEAQNKRLLEGIEKILSQAYPKAKENEIYTVWSQLPSLQGVDKESRDLAVYNNMRCFRRDSHKVDNYLKLLRCRIVHNNNC